jgi:quercetin dioxygenase-like cupin family protein
MMIRKLGIVSAAAAAVVLLAIGVLPAQAGDHGATTSTSTTTATTATPPPPPAVVSKNLATAPVSPLLLLGHGQTLAGTPWSALLLTRGMSDGYVVDNVFPPGATTGWHSHPGPSIIFVVSGTVTNYDSSDPHCAARTYSGGSSFNDAGGTDVHLLRNEGTEAAETIAVQLIPQGQARKTAQPEPNNCHVS